MSKREPIPQIIVLVILLSLFFLSYLAWTTQLIIFHDSIGYQNLAEMFARGRWKEYFATGPGREPLYSLLIACSMRLAQWFSLDYLAVHVTFQIGILILTQFLTFKVLKKLRVSDGICALTLAYMGLSPALTSSGLILFSEIITYPIVLWLLLAVTRAWSQSETVSRKQSILNALNLSLPSLLITFTKGAFELVIPFLLLPFAMKTIQALRERKQEVIITTVLFILTVFCLFELPVVAYKLTNKHFNGIYALTDRGPEALYGNTARRMQPLSLERTQIALTYMTGPDVCSRLYGERCLPWAFLASDILGAEKAHVLIDKGLSKQKVNAALIKESIPHVFSNPLQYLFLSVVEGSKILFWEAPEISYVVYPDALDQIYNGSWLRYPLRFALFALSGWGLVMGCRFFWFNRKKIFNNKTDDEKPSCLFFIMFLILVFTGLHSIFFILPRYALPMAPLFLVLIAWRVDAITQQKRQ